MIRQAVLVDLRVRARSATTMVTVLVLLAAVAIAVVLCFRLLGQQPAPTVGYARYGLPGLGGSVSADGSAGPSPLSSLTSAGRGAVVLVVLAGVLAVFGGVIGAMLGAGTIAGEYERETLDLVLTTDMGARGLTTARLLATFLYCLLFALVMLPAFSFLLVFSSVPLADVLIAAAIVLGSLLCGSGVGVFFSAVLRSTVAAFLSAAAVSALLFVGGAGAYLLVAHANADPPMLAQLLLLPSPVAALLSSAAGQFQGNSVVLLPALLHASPQHPVHLAGQWQLPIPFWVLTLALDVLLTAALAALGSRSMSATFRVSPGAKPPGVNREAAVRTRS